ncbi:MAG: hypothetical protein FD173_1032 [Gallionellaceae bacterium]|nr:MAG: hypothetical protein FD173_1032 [Gallionellaceae bacterium]
MESIVIRNVLFVLLLACLPVAEGYAAAGKFNFVIGDVRVVNASGERKAVRGGEVEANDTIISGKNSMAQLRLSDGAFIALRADTELRIDKYQYDSKKPEANDTVLSLAKGTMRAFTGAIASINKERFKMKTATATIGIRGSGNVLNFSPVGNLTLNHTILGSHVVTTFDPSGVMRTLVSMPGQTVQVNPAGVMRFVPTPAFILEAVTASRKTEPDQPQSAAKSNQPGQPAENKKQVQGAGTEPQPGKGNAPQSPAQGGDASAQGEPGAMPGGPMGGAPFAEGAPVPGTGAPGMEAPGMYGTPAMDPALAVGGIAPGMYGAVPMPTTTLGMYGVPAMDPTMMAGGMTPSMYGAGAGVYGAGAGVYGAGAGVYGAGAGVYGAGAGAYGAGAGAYGAGAGTYGTGPLSINTTPINTAQIYPAQINTVPIYTANPYAWAYDANGNLLPGYTLVNGVPTLSTAASGVGCSGAGAGSISGTLYCDGKTWIQPAVDQPCGATGIVVGTFTCSGGIWVSTTTTTTTTTTATGACTTGSVSGGQYCDAGNWITPAVNTACTAVAGTVVGTFTCSGGIWITTTTTTAAAVGGACSGAGSVSGSLYCNGSTWASPATVQAAVAAGGACTAGTVSGIYYCNVSTWATPAVGGACGLAAGTVVGNFECSGTVWIAATYATPAAATAPTVGMMYDAFAALVTIPTGGYRNIFYSYATAGNVPAMEFARDNTVVAAGSPTTTFAAPSTNGTATSSTNAANFTVGSSLVDFGYDSVSGMSWGRWQGSWLATGANPVTAVSTNNLHWFATSVQTQAVTLPVTGTWNYTLVGNTNPTDNAGVVGTLNSATFSANFTAQTVNVGINVSMPASSANAALPVTLNATATAVPILAGGNFKTSAPTVTCTAGNCGATSGAIGGHFSAPNGAGVGVGYGLNNGTQTINGVAVFRH